jgi:hypothetical protein
LSVFCVDFQIGLDAHGHLDAVLIGKGLDLRPPRADVPRFLRVALGVGRDFPVGTALVGPEVERSPLHLQVGEIAVPAVGEVLVERAFPSRQNGQT